MFWKRLSIISYKSIKGINKAVSKWFAVNIRDIFKDDINSRF